MLIKNTYHLQLSFSLNHVLKSIHAGIALVLDLNTQYHKENFFTQFRQRV